MNTTALLIELYFLIPTLFILSQKQVVDVNKENILSISFTIFWNCIFAFLTWAVIFKRIINKFYE